MDLKEIKKITNFARRAGVKSIKIDGLEISFKDEIIIQRPRTPRLVKPEAGKTELKQGGIPTPPTLDEINKFIYEEKPEAG